MSRLELFREAVSREKDRDESEMRREGHGCRGVMCGRALGRDIVVYKVVIQGIQVLSASPMDH